MSSKNFDTTVIIPTKNRLDFLVRAVKSVSDQVVKPSKIIIVDDASDSPVDIESFRLMFDIDIEVVRNNSSKGGGACRNLGVSLAMTEFVSFLDDDDSWDEYYLANISLASMKEANSNKIAYYTSKKLVLSNKLDEVNRIVLATEIPEDSELLKGNTIGTTSCVTINRGFFTIIGGFDELLPAFQDFELWLRVVLHSGKFMPVTDSYVYYTVHLTGKQISGNFSNHLNAGAVMTKKYGNSLNRADFQELIKTLNFFTAKAIHRKKYFASLPFTVRTLYGLRDLKVLALFVPYRVLNFLGLYTS